MNWTDIYDIAISLEESHPGIDVKHIKFTDLRNLVMSLPEFTGHPQHCNEKILEAIQAAWLDEKD
jgi:FeS assembly protein IscX